MILKNVKNRNPILIKNGSGRPGLAKTTQIPVDNALSYRAMSLLYNPNELSFLILNSNKGYVTKLSSIISSFIYSLDNIPKSFNSDICFNT